jgi:hypothetical protein
MISVFLPSSGGDEFSLINHKDFNRTTDGERQAERGGVE